MLVHIKDNRNFWNVVVDNRSYQFDPSHANYQELVDCVKNGNGEEFKKLIDKAKAIEDWSEGDFYVKGGILFYNTEEVHTVITQRIFEMIKEGFDYKPMLRFLERLYKNPSYRAINELYTFLQHKFLPITTDGCFLAYKAVRPDYMDKYSGTIRNQVGDKPSLPRYNVDDNCSVGCSRGLHVGAIDYVKSYGDCGDIVVICKVDPMNVVSVPLDASHQKVRCCEYEVVGIYEDDLLPAVVDTYDEVYDDEDEDWSEDDDFHNSDELEMYEEFWGFNSKEEDGV